MNHPNSSFGREERVAAASYWLAHFAGVVVAATAVLYLVAVAPGVPYHVQDLFGSSPNLPQALLFALMVLLALGPPALLGLQLVRTPALWVWVFPIAMLLHAAAVFLVFRFATPIESVHDLVGLPVWGIPAEFERLVRFVGVFLMVSVPISGGTALLYAINRSFQPLRFLWWLGYAVLLLGVSYGVVIGSAATDNVTLLLRGDAHPLAWIALSVWMLMMAFGASVLAERLSGVLGGTITVLFALLLLLPLSFAVLFLAMEPRVLGSGSNLSALGFLLSVDRADYLPDDLSLFWRYAVAYVGIIMLLGFAQYPVWIAYATRRFARHPLDQNRRPEGAEGDAAGDADRT
jgi:hypothetical protein